MADRVGQQLGNYRLMRLLGEGGFAEVYLGEHVYLKTLAAIKVLYSRLAEDDLEAFLSEARIIANLEHPNIVRVLEFGVEQNTPFLVMQYAPNGSLRQRHPKDTRLSPATILPYVRQAAAALQYAHDQKLIHRDVKPENLLIGRNQEILLSDFGIAVVAQSTGEDDPQHFGGTVAYMAPEQLLSKPRPASDQYALGVTIYEWLTGERPFSGTYLEVASKHALTPPPTLRDKVPGLSLEIEVVVMAAMAKDPQQRFASIRAFANAFEHACQSEQSIMQTMPSHMPPPVESLPIPPTSLAATQRGVPTPNLSTQPAPTPPPGEPQPARQGISRRVFIGGLAAGTTLIASGITLLAFAEGKNKSTQTSQGTLPYIYHGHSASVIAVAWSPDSRRIASASFDKTVQVWDAVTGAHVVTYRGHSSQVWAVAWSPDGQQIASAGLDRTVQVWDAISGGHFLTYAGHSDLVLGLAWSPDSTRIASASYDTTVQVWGVATGTLLFPYHGHTDRVWAVSWAADGQRIASAGKDKTVQVWDAASGTPIYTYRGHTAGVIAAPWSPDSRFIASGSYDKTVQVWEADNGSSFGAFRGHSDLLLGVAWSSDGAYIASASQDKTAQVWQAFTQDRLFTYRGHADAVRTVAWSPNGTYLASGSLDGIVQIWQAPVLPMTTTPTPPPTATTIGPIPSPTGIPGATPPPTVGPIPNPTPTPTVGPIPSPTPTP